MDGAEGSEVAVARLPDDVLAEILSRLNAKSLGRSKCVSKPWRDLIADRLRCENLPQTLQGFLYFDSGSRREKSPRPNYGHFINLLGESVPVPLLDPSFAFMKEHLDEAISLLDSCNGLLLFGRRWGSDTYDSRGYIVCNPVTEQWAAVPSSSSTPLPEEVVHGSGRMVLRRAWKGSQTGLWSEWRQWEPEGCMQSGYYGTMENPSCGRTFVNGMLHFIFYEFRREEFEILAVDGEGKTCRVIRWPEEHRFVISSFIGRSQGRLHCISGLRKQNVEGYHSKFTGLSIWILEDYDAEEWVLKHNVSFLQLFGRSFLLAIEYYVIALHPDRNLVFLVHHGDQKLISYDLDSREVCVLCTLGQVSSCVTMYHPCFESSVLAYEYKH